MTRRKRARSRTIWLDWTPEIAKAFNLVPGSWTPPAKIKLQGTFKRSTWSARFTTPDGRVNTAKLRVRYDPHLDEHVVDGEEVELLKVRMTATAADLKDAAA